MEVVISQYRMNLNALKIVGPFLLILGTAGYLFPDLIPFVSTAPFYNLFNIDMGIIALIIVFWGNRIAAMCFSILLGCAFLYQTLAAWKDWFPDNYVKWTFINDIINIDLGLILLFIVLLEGFRRKNENDTAEG